MLSSPIQKVVRTFFLACILFFSLSGALFFLCIDSYFAHLSLVLSESWQRTESDALRRGDVFGPLKRQDYGSQGRQILQGIAAYRLENKSYKKIFSVGSPWEFARSQWTHDRKTKEIIRHGIFGYRVFLQIPNHRETLIVLDFKPALGARIFGFFVVAILMLFAGFVSAFFRLIKTEHDLRIKCLSKAIIEISSQAESKDIDHLKPSHELSSLWPEISGEWNSLITYVISLKLNLIKITREAAVAKTVQMLAHDVRKPFSILKLGLRQLRAVGNNPNTIDEIVSTIESTVEASRIRVDGILTDILELNAKSNADLVESISVRELIDTAIHDAFEGRDSKKVNFRFDFLDDFFVAADSHRVQRVFTNIVDNARQAIKGTGTISFFAEKTELYGRPEIKITIHNTGSYIALEDHKAIFEEFFTKGKFGGTGLGLAIAKKVVESYGGTIRCESALDSGTAFIFTLPPYLVPHTDSIKQACHKNSKFDCFSFAPNSNVDAIIRQI